MTIVLWVVGIVFALYVLLLLRVSAASKRRDEFLDQLVEPVLRLVREHDEEAEDRIRECAAIPARRNHLYRKLRELEKHELFPEEFRVTEKVAESDLALWLMHPNELAAPPAHMELMDQVEVEEAGRKGQMLLFRFRVLAPHWAAERAWMAGVAGPYWDDDTEPLHGRYTFSELQSYDGTSSEEHVAFLRKASGRRGLVVRG